MLSDNPEGRDGVRNGKEVQKEGTYVYLWQIHVDVWQKPTQYCKAIILQLKINKLKKKEKTEDTRKLCEVFSSVHFSHSVMSDSL